MALNNKFPFIKYTTFATTVFRFLNSYVPLKLGFLKHKKGFVWKIDGWYSLWTYLTGCEPYTTKLVEEIIGRGTTTFICVGANRGWFPLVVQQVSQNTMQYIFEPNPNTFAVLQENLLRNRTRVKTFDIAISDFVGQSNLFSYSGINDGASTLFPNEATNSLTQMLSLVQTESLDSLFSKGQLLEDPNTLLFLDIEGAEFRALSGSMEFLKRLKPVIILEINCLMLKASGSSAEDLFAMLARLGYQLYWIHEKGHLVKQDPIEAPAHLNELRAQDSTNYIVAPDGYDVKKTRTRGTPLKY